MEKILVLDFGGQYNQLIARKVRSNSVYAEIVPYTGISVEEIKERRYSGIIMTGGPNSVYQDGSPRCDLSLLECGVPILGICYGAQLLAYLAGGAVNAKMESAEYGKTRIFTEKCALFQEMPEESICWMSHTDQVTDLPIGFRTIAKTDHCFHAAFCDEKRKLYGVQFHPEVNHTVYGEKILSNFLFHICGCSGDWLVKDYADLIISHYREELAGKKVLLGLSGGVDSSVAALLLNQAIGENLLCVFVDHGLLRKGEADFVEETFRRTFGLNLVRVNAQERFFKRLSGITDPERKRKIIGEEFIRVFEETAKHIGTLDALAQGTIYPDVIESGKGDSAVIKSHHNVGGLPENIGFKEIIEPLRDLFKDEVRIIGSKLGLPAELVWRQPFPGPGLAVRIIGEVTPEKVEIIQQADAVFREEVERSGFQILPDQFFAVLTDIKSVGVKGDARAYGYVVALRAVSTDDFMTAEWTKLPYEVLERASTRITNEIHGISRVVYDISSKPPATVEWE
ncbi:MAG: glutamine-hydrolyzing GMP synthase [Oscillospiraceae bacterium]|nr:glutamine-hydrolyzing GMP synthase [Oscillospiraceae bacterium]